MIVFASHYPYSEEFENFIASKRKNDKKAYIPASAYSSFTGFKDEGIFKSLSEIFSKRNSHDESTFYLDKTIDEAKLFSHGIIEIGGGNTYELLSLLRKSNIIDGLKEYEKNGGIIVGCSAGAVVLGTTTLLSTIADENRSGITDFTGLDMLEKFPPLCFKPHIDLSLNFNSALFQDFANALNINVITAAENAYVIFDDDKMYQTSGIEFYIPKENAETQS